MPPSPPNPKDKTRREHLARVERILFRSPSEDFCILALDDGHTALGPANADSFPRGTIFRFLGRWEDNAERGPRFRFSTFVVHQPAGRFGIVKYLTDLCEGIGTKTAEKIFHKFGGDAPAMLREKPEEVAAACGLDPAVCANAGAELDRAKRFEATRIDLFDVFSNRGFSGKLIDAVIKKWGAKAPQTIRRNPFALLGFPSAGFKRCDRLWADLGLPADALKRQALCAANALKNESQGHTWMRAEDLAAKLRDLIPAAKPKKAFQFALRARKLKKYRDAAGVTWLADYNRATAEERVAAAVQKLSRSPCLWPTDRIPVSQVEGDRLPSAHQVERLRRATESAVGMLLGGPGTGKSHTLAYLVRETVATYGRETVCVCAPTGKAAVRATQALALAGLDVKAKTIHSTLAIGRNGHDGDGWGFVHNKDNPLPYRFIFVDEPSMLDTSLMADLLDATVAPRVLPARPEQTVPAGELLPPRCRRCNRVLNTPESIGIGYGPECAKHVDPAEFAPVGWERADADVVIPAQPEQVLPGTHVLLVGDPYQLPPVGHGAPLRDLIDAGVAHGELTEVRRNAGQIVHACVRIKNGESFETADTLDLDATPPKNLKLLTARDEAHASEVLTQTLQRMTKFNPVWQTQVIVARNAKGELSRKKLNELLQPMLNGDGYAVAGNPFKVGDKIICTRNSRMHRVEPVGVFHDDYAADMAREAGNYQVVYLVDEFGDRTNDPEEVFVANGEIGRVVAVAKGLSVARFSEGEALVKIPMGKDRPDDGPEADGDADGGRGCNFDHAYAVTCHRLQGSESPCIIVMGDDGASMLTTREWIYTAISRASKLCILIGQKATFDKMKNRVSLLRRKTFLKELIQEVAAA